MVNIIPWLEALDFKKNGNTYTLNIKTTSIDVDIENKKIEYPKLKEVGRATTLNFSSEENFVVLEIIIGLFKQGYLPNQISIEKSYQLGRNKKSGNADITVSDNSGEPFFNY